MADETRNALGPAGHVLRANIQRIREAQRLTYVELSERLADAGRSIPVLGLRRIEKGERRVDADDLLALAYALGVAPVDLLVPGAAADHEPYPVTAALTVTTGTARDWIRGEGFLSVSAGDPRDPFSQPSTGPDAADLAALVRWMPKERGEAVVRRWAHDGDQDQEGDR